MYKEYLCNNKGKDFNLKISNFTKPFSVQSTLFTSCTVYSLPCLKAVQYTVYLVYKLYSVQFTLFTSCKVNILPCLQAVQCTVYLVYKLYSVQFTFYIIWTVNSLPCLQAVKCTVYLVYKLDSVQYTLRISCTVYTVQQILWRNYRVSHEMFTHARYLREHWTGWNVLL